MRTTLRTILILMFFFQSLPSRSAVLLLPETTHQRFLTYGLFVDNQSSLLFRDSGKAFGSLAGSIALVSFEGLKGKPQIVLTGSVHSAFRLADGAFNSETADSRMSLLWDTELSSDWLLSLGFSHASGHVSDDVLDLDLLPLDVGIETFPIRIVYQGSSFFRFGITFQPTYAASAPPSKMFQANEFFEWFPYGDSGDYHRFTPYLALGFEQFGHNEIDLSAHAQLGAYLGNHRDAKYFTSLRAVLGAYTGPDPRLKYYYYKDKTARFIYFGLMFDL